MPLHIYRIQLQQQARLPFDDAFEDSDPDPGCLDLDPSGQDSDAGTQLPSLGGVFENTCLEDLLTAIKFIQHFFSLHLLMILTAKWIRTLLLNVEAIL